MLLLMQKNNFSNDPESENTMTVHNNDTLKVLLWNALLHLLNYWKAHLTNCKPPAVFY